MIEFYYEIYFKNSKYLVNKIIKKNNLKILNDNFFVSKNKLNILISKLKPEQYKIIHEKKDDIYDKLLEGNLQYP